MPEWPQVYEWVLSIISHPLFTLLFGAALVYWRERYMEKQKRHRETVKEMLPVVKVLKKKVHNLVNVATSPENPEPDVSIQPWDYPEDAAELAERVEMMATRLKEGDLKDFVLETLNQNYSDPHDIWRNLMRLRDRLRKEAYPRMGEVKERYRFTDTEWAGPANPRFAEKLHEEGIKRKGADE